jgi:hypothetical protein
MGDGGDWPPVALNWFQKEKLADRAVGKRETGYGKNNEGGRIHSRAALAGKSPVPHEKGELAEIRSLQWIC